MQASAICLLALGVLSLCRRKSTPIVGACLGIGLTGAAFVVFPALVLLFALFNLVLPTVEPVATWTIRLVTGFIYFVLPFLALSFSVLRQPREEQFQHPPAN